jgi:hypothetical protein
MIELHTWMPAWRFVCWPPRMNWLLCIRFCIRPASVPLLRPRRPLVPLLPIAIHLTVPLPPLLLLLLHSLHRSFFRTLLFLFSPLPESETSSASSFSPCVISNKQQSASPMQLDDFGSSSSSSSAPTSPAFSPLQIAPYGMCYVLFRLFHCIR